MKSTLKPTAKKFFPLSLHSNHLARKTQSLTQLDVWNFAEKDKEFTRCLLDESYSGRTLSLVLRQWEENTNKYQPSEKVPLTILCYNVEGWNTRHLEVVDLVYKVDASISVLAEVGELWNKFSIPNFNTFQQNGANKNSGVCVAVGKHLRAIQIQIEIENTAIVDVFNLSDPIRTIGIYWPHSQERNLDDLCSYITQETIITGDFNASLEEWNCPVSDKRGRILKEWIEKNNLIYIPASSHSSKRSLRNIDHTYSNIDGISAETIRFGTSDHWPTVVTCENIGYEIRNFVPHVKWHIFKGMLVLLQDFWIQEQTITSVDEWYKNYTRFLATLKYRTTVWKEREKYRPSLPPLIIDTLKGLRRIRNKYYRERMSGCQNEETRVLLRVMNREVRKGITIYKSSSWQSFLIPIREKSDKPEKAFWSHLSRVYKSKILPFSKLDTGHSLISNKKEIVDILSSYYENQFKIIETDKEDPKDIQVEEEYKIILNELSTSEDKLEPTTAFEIIKYIKRLKPKKSSGIDQISNYMILGRNESINTIRTIGFSSRMSPPQ